MLLSVIIPAYNEERYLPRTLDCLQRSIGACNCPVEVIVVDNDSADRTAEVAESFGAAVISESVHNIGRVRNVGAKIARGEVLIFLDADTTVPSQFLARIAEVMADPTCLGGSAEILHKPASKFLRAYLGGWRWMGLRLGVVQGAAQFCRRAAYATLSGYDETHFMGEDVDFHWRLKALCSRTGGHVKRLSDVQVLPDPRRFDQLPIWRTLVWTNPLFLVLFRKRAWAWQDWYTHLPR